MSKHPDSFEIFPWNENLETGIAIVDEQHKRLVDLLNELASSLVFDDDVELTRIFEELVAYANLHFETEEAIWAPCFGDDPWLVAHQDTHSSFLPTVIKLKEAHIDKPPRETNRQVVKFIIRWLTYHIIDSDRRMAIVLHNMGAGASLVDAKKISDEAMRDSPQVLIDTMLIMYDELSSRTLELMRERVKRKKMGKKLSQANRELKKLAITDQLTGLFNRRYFGTVFEAELRRAKREKRNLTFVMLDIDHFKNLNDHYGHVQGDSALKMVAKRLKQICRRPSDFVFRLGGEEFGAIVADHSSFSGVDFAEKIRARIENLGIPNVAVMSQTI